MPFETFDFAPSTRVYDERGFLRVTGKAARTGVYSYLAKELELTDRDPNEIVYVYRSPDEVFNADSLATYLHADVTNNHPTTLVDAKTYRGVSVGHCLSAKQNGSFVDVELMVKDAQAIKDIESGKSQLSPGYTTTYVRDPGNCPDTGQPYEFKQTGIDVNHIAIVERGRGGAQVRIDDNQGVKPMPGTVKLPTGRSIEVADEATAALLSDSIDALTKRALDAEAAAAKAEAEKDAMEEELAEEKTKSTDAAISARLQEIAATSELARKVAGDTFTCDSVDPMLVKRQALAVKRPTIDWAAKSDAYVSAAFDIAAGEPVTQNPAQLAQLAKDAATTTTTTTDAKPSGYAQFKARQSEAWKKGN